MRMPALGAACCALTLLVGPSTPASAASSGVASSDGALTVMVINKTHAKITSRLAVRNFAGKKKAAVYRYSSAHTTSIRKVASAKVHAGRITTSYPASSITLLVLPKR